jgi:hypothetical protein
MSLKKRIERLDELLPEPQPPRRPVPTGSIAEFIRGLFAGDFSLEDIDKMSIEQMNVAYEFVVCVLCLSPDAQAFNDVTPWARRAQDEWEKAKLSTLTPEEMEQLRQCAREWYPPKNPQPKPEATELPSAE